MRIHFYSILKSILKFVNWQADGVKGTNGAALVTLGSWSEHAQTDTKGQSSMDK